MAKNSLNGEGRAYLLGQFHGHSKVVLDGLGGRGLLLLLMLVVLLLVCCPGGLQLGGQVGGMLLPRLLFPDFSFPALPFPDFAFPAFLFYPLLFSLLRFAALPVREELFTMGRSFFSFSKKCI